MPVEDGGVHHGEARVTRVAEAPEPKDALDRRQQREVVVVVDVVRNVTTAIPAGDTQVIAPTSDGTQYGAVHCNKGLGSGVQTDTFTTLDSGNVRGLYTLYLATGTVHGKFNLTPAEGPPLTTGTFQSAFYTETLTVTGGTGAYLHAKSKGVGTLTCSSPDDVHMSCADKFKVVNP
jgi:hypothetical protein